jgi:hypothetical protein
LVWLKYVQPGSQNAEESMFGSTYRFGGNGHVKLNLVQEKVESCTGHDVRVGFGLSYFTIGEEIFVEGRVYEIVVEVEFVNFTALFLHMALS